MKFLPMNRAVGTRSVCIPIARWGARIYIESSLIQFGILRASTVIWQWLGDLPGMRN